jgi:hypothetical protein
VTLSASVDESRGLRIITLCLFLTLRVC